MYTINEIEVSTLDSLLDDIVLIIFEISCSSVSCWPGWREEMTLDLTMIFLTILVGTIVAILTFVVKIIAVMIASKS
jgi:hypothetical protein